MRNGFNLQEASGQDLYPKTYYGHGSQRVTLPTKFYPVLSSPPSGLGDGEDDPSASRPPPSSSKGGRSLWPAPTASPPRRTIDTASSLPHPAAQKRLIAQTS